MTTLFYRVYHHMPTRVRRNRPDVTIWAAWVDDLDRVEELKRKQYKFIDISPSQKEEFCQDDSDWRLANLKLPPSTRKRIIESKLKATRLFDQEDQQALADVLGMTLEQLRSM